MIFLLEENCIIAYLYNLIVEQNKNIDKAIFFFNKYLKIEPGDQQCLKTLKQIYEARGDEEKLEEINKQLATE